MEPSPQQLLMGCISGVFGVKGWVRVKSYSQPEAQLFDYQPWLVLRQRQTDVECIQVEDFQLHAKGPVAKLAGVDDRDSAQALKGAQIYILREQLPKLSEGQYYWMDLEGLQVETLTGIKLGTVAYLFETGANDVLVVKGDKQRFIPYLPEQVIKQVDLSAKIIKVDWDPEF